MSGRRQTGYTLIEVVVALALMMTLAAFAYSGLALAARARAEVATASDRLADVQAAFALLERDLVHLRQRPVRVQGQADAPALRSGVGVDAAVELTTAGAGFGPSGADPGLERVAWLRRGDRLVRRSWVALDRTVATPVQERELLHGVRALEVRSLDRTRTWRESWPSPQAPRERDDAPLAVRVRMVLEERGEIVRIVSLRRP